MNSKKQENNKDIVINCPSCRRNFTFDDKHIPEGERYKIKCPFCNVTLGRVKGEIY